MAVTWKRIAYYDELHAQNTDTGTSENDFSIGDGADSNKTLSVANGDANEPNLRYNASTNKWEYSNNGVSWANFSTAVVSDTEIAKYKIASGESISVGNYEQIFLIELYIIEEVLVLAEHGILGIQ